MGYKKRGAGVLISRTVKNTSDNVHVKQGGKKGLSFWQGGVAKSGRSSPEWGRGYIT